MTTSNVNMATSEEAKAKAMHSKANALGGKATGCCKAKPPRPWRLK